MIYFIVLIFLLFSFIIVSIYIYIIYILFCSISFRLVERGALLLYYKWIRVKSTNYLNNVNNVFFYFSFCCSCVIIVITIRSTLSEPLDRNNIFNNDHLWGNIWSKINNKKYWEQKQERKKNNCDSMFLLFY